MLLYALFDKKSSVMEYFIASCDEDAMRIASVMMMGSRPIYEFAEDFSLVRIQKLASSRDLYPDDEIIVDLIELKRQIVERRKEHEQDEN